MALVDGESVRLLRFCSSTLASYGVVVVAGVDPGYVSWGLMGLAQFAVDKHKLIEPVAVLQARIFHLLSCPSLTRAVPQSAWTELVKASGSRESVPGSTTALIASITMSTNPILTVANIGDCACLLLRAPNADGPLVHRAVTRVARDRGMPAQLGPHASWGHSTADDAEQTTSDIQRGDVVVLMSDGITDNVRSSEIASIVSKAVQPALVAAAAAHATGLPPTKTLVDAAHEAAVALVTRAWVKPVKPDDATAVLVIVQ
jgi:serine/threonine protein phosphatase PrpC